MGRLNIVKIVFLNLIYRFNETPIKIPVSYFADMNKHLLKFIWKTKTPSMANTMLKEKNQRADSICL